MARVSRAKPAGVPLDLFLDRFLETERNYYIRVMAVDGSRNAAAFVSTWCLAWLGLQAYGLWLTGLYELNYWLWPIAIILAWWTLHLILKLTVRMPWRD